MRVSARILAALVTVAAASAAVPASAAPRDKVEERSARPPNVLRPVGRLGYDWRGTPPYIAGTTVLSRGEWIHQDRPFDDTGADTFPDTEAAGLQHAYPGLCEATAAYRHGEYAYPEDPELRRNGADLVELRLAVAKGNLHVLVQLQSLFAADRVAARLRINERELLIRGQTATLDGHRVAARADTAANTLEARVPMRRLPRGPWTLQATTGVPDGDPITWVDAAFVKEPIVGVYNCWHDKAQSAAFAAGVLPTATLDPARLRRRESDPATLVRGPMVRLHVPFFDNGEGLEPEPTHGQQSTGAIYRGKLQPYGAYVPKAYDPRRPAPLLMALHCLNCNHNTFHTAAWPGLAELAEKTGAIVVTPLAYGEGRHYEEEAELDVLEVLADVRSRYEIDPDRVILSGMSMGALGTFRLGLLYPDLWARTLGIGNYTTPYCVTVSNSLCGSPNYTTLFENARNLPWGLLNGMADELTPVTLSREYADRFASLGYSHRLWEFLRARHDPSLHGQVTEAVADWLTSARRVRDPARVTYVIDRSLFNEKFGLIYDRAYWVRNIRLAADAERGRVDAVSGRGTVLRTRPVEGSGTTQAGEWTMTGHDPVAVRKRAGNVLAVTASGIASMTIDATAAGLSSRGLKVSVRTDTPLTIRIPGVGTIRARPGKATTHTLGPRATGAERTPLEATTPWLFAGALAASGLRRRTVRG